MSQVVGNLDTESNDILDWTKMVTSEVTIGRLRKRIAKLQEQRDSYKEKLGYYEKVISMQPYIERRYQSFTEMKAEIARVRALEARVKEQEKLIKLLMKNEPNNTQTDG